MLVRHRHLPPGPRSLPLIGNLVEVLRISRAHRPWVAYRELSKKYGPIVSLRIMGRCLVIINNIDIALELLEKRSAKYSSRPESAMPNLCGWEWGFPFMPYGQAWRINRRMLWEHFQPTVVNRYDAFVENGARRLLVALLSSPEQLDENVRYSIGTTLVTMTYGTQSRESMKEALVMLDDAMSSIELLLSGTNPIEFFPVLARVPTWLPGTAFLRRLADYRDLLVTVRERPWARVKAAVDDGFASPSIATSMVAEGPIHGGNEADARENLCKNTAAIIYTAGIDTTHVTLCSFFLAMSLHPHVQKKAQAELDAVVGPGRLPTHADREFLPYTNAVMKEILRWHPVGPLGVAHASTADDEYNGYLIPDKSIVMVNVWSITRDPELYPDPESFIPERYLGPNTGVLDPATYAFGFGRRICPGRHFVDTALFIYIASVLHAFDISPPLDHSGRPIRIEPRATTGLASHLEDCRCTIKPRSLSAEALIRNWEADVPCDIETERPV
ncbi:cytochrome P450 [Fomes fomentarius]|nr:cytochrome P450 [Fomes fomentarius]